MISRILKRPKNIHSNSGDTKFDFIHSLNHELIKSSKIATFASIFLIVFIFIAQLKLGINSPKNQFLLTGLLFLLATRWWISSMYYQFNTKIWNMIFTFHVVALALLWHATLTQAVNSEVNIEVHYFYLLLSIGILSSTLASLGYSRRDFIIFSCILLYTVIHTIDVIQNESLRFICYSIVGMYSVYLLIQREKNYQLWRSHYLESREFSDILDGFPGGISIIEKDHYVYANSKVSDTIGYSNSELKNKQVGFVSNNVDFKDNLKEFLASDKLFDQKEIAIKSITGPRYHLFNFKMLDPNKKRVLIASIDIHEKKLLEQEAEAHRDQAITSSKMAALGEMSSGVAHEINNPLSIIMGKVYIMKKTMESKTEINREKFEQFIDLVDKASLRISNIVSGLRTFARDGVRDPMAEVDLNQIVKNTLFLCTEKLSHKSIKLEIDYSPTPIIVSCRETQISQIFLNFVVNSMDAIELQENPWIHVKIHTQNSFGEIVVTDCGKGIPAAIREKLMKPFFTTKPVGKGTGLGLSISKNIAIEHGGDILIDENYPNTRFILKVPIANAALNDDKKTA